MTSEGLGVMFEGDSADMCAGKFPLVSMGGRAVGLACADPGARTPIGASGNSLLLSWGRGNQQWEYSHDRKRLHHAVSGKCLALTEKKDKLAMEVCDDNNDRQHWLFQNFNATIS